MKLYAFISTDANGNEALCGGTIAGALIPFVTASPRLLEEMKSASELLTKQTGVQIDLYSYTGREHVERIGS